MAERSFVLLDGPTRAKLVFVRTLCAISPLSCAIRIAPGLVVERDGRLGVYPFEYTDPEARA